MDSEFDPQNEATWPNLLTVEQAVRILGISQQTLTKYTNAAKIKAIKIGTRKDRRYPKESMLSVLKKGF